MAKQMNGFMGGFSGKLGTAVGYQWNGMWCMRSRPAAVRNPRTAQQQAHRACFAEEVRLAARMAWAVRTGLTALAREQHMTSRNLFVRLNQPAFAEREGSLEVDYGMLQLSAGPVAPVAVTDASVDGRGVLTVAFDKNPMHLSANAYDSVYIYVYSPEGGSGYLFAPVYRRQQSAAALLTSDLAGFDLQVYAFVVDGHGRASSTAYGGVVAAQAADMQPQDGPMAAVADLRQAAAVGGDAVQTSGAKEVATQGDNRERGPDDVASGPHDGGDLRQQ